MDGRTPELLDLSVADIIKAVNEAQFTSLIDLRDFIRKHLAVWRTLEAAPIGELPKRVVRHRQGTIRKPQGLLALVFDHEAPAKIHQSEHVLGVATWLPDANNEWLDAIWARLNILEGTEENSVAAITAEGEAVIREIIRHAAQDTDFTPTTVKYAASRALLTHFQNQAKKLRDYKTFREFGNFTELEDFLRLHCPYLYCLGKVQIQQHTVLSATEQFLCLSSPFSPNRGLVIGRRNRETNKVELTPQGKAFITHTHTSRIKGNSSDNVSLGSAMIHDIHKYFAKPQANTSIKYFDTIEAAAEYLEGIPALRHIPYLVGKDCIWIKRANKRKFKLVQRIKEQKTKKEKQRGTDKFVETSELSALLENYFTITICIEELAEIDRREKELKTTKEKEISQKALKALKEGIIEKLVNLLTADPISLNLPTQQAWQF